MKLKIKKKHRMVQNAIDNTYKLGVIGFSNGIHSISVERYYYTRCDVSDYVPLVKNNKIVNAKESEAK